MDQQLLSDLMELGVTSGFAHGRDTLVRTGRNKGLEVCAMGYAGVGWCMQHDVTVGPKDQNKIMRGYDDMVTHILQPYGVTWMGQGPIGDSELRSCPYCTSKLSDNILGIVVHLNDYHKLEMDAIIDQVRRYEVDHEIREVLDVTGCVTTLDYAMTMEGEDHV